MLVLITYDVKTETEAGKSRLRRVSKKCQDYGQRVQNSVFECLIDPAQLKELQDKLLKIIDPEVDSLRFYYLGDNWKHRVEHVGAKPGIDLEGAIITYDVIASREAVKQSPCEPNAHTSIRAGSQEILHFNNRILL